MTTSALPDHTGYVAAAYLVFAALLLIYLAIMATKLSRLEKETTEILALARRSELEAVPEETKDRAGSM